MRRDFVELFANRFVRMDRVFIETDDLALDAQARRFWRTRAADEPARRVRKLWVFLVRRGFPADLVQARLRRLWPRWSDALEGLEPEDDAAEG